MNVPSFIWKEDVSIVTPSFGAVTGDIAYGGAFYFIPTALLLVPRSMSEMPTG